MIELTPLRDEDSDPMFEWINDRDLVERSSPFKPVGREHHDHWFRSIREREDVEIFAIRLRDGNRLIGSCQLNRIDRRYLTCGFRSGSGTLPHRAAATGPRHCGCCSPTPSARSGWSV